MNKSLLILYYVSITNRATPFFIRLLLYGACYQSAFKGACQGCGIRGGYLIVVKAEGEIEHVKWCFMASFTASFCGPHSPLRQTAKGSNQVRLGNKAPSSIVLRLLWRIWVSPVASRHRLRHVFVPCMGSGWFMLPM